MRGTEKGYFGLKLLLHPSTMNHGLFGMNQPRSIHFNPKERRRAPAAYNYPTAAADFQLFSMRVDRVAITRNHCSNKNNNAGNSANGMELSTHFKGNHSIFFSLNATNFPLITLRNPSSPSVGIIISLKNLIFLALIYWGYGEKYGQLSPSE